LGKAGEPELHSRVPSFNIGRSIALRDGRDVTLIAAGGLLAEALKAADILEKEGIAARVLSMHTVKPLDREAVLAAARETRAVITIEENTVIGGLGSAVAEVLSETDGSPPLRRLGISDSFVEVAGSRPYILSRCGLSAEGIVKSVREVLHAVDH
jgi:transketolase